MTIMDNGVKIELEYHHIPKFDECSPNSFYTIKKVFYKEKELPFKIEGCCIESIDLDEFKVKIKSKSPKKAKLKLKTENNDLSVLKEIKVILKD